MKINRFSIIEMSVVLFVILVLMAIGAAYFLPVQKSINTKSQQLEFDTIKTYINTLKIDKKKSIKSSSKYVTIFDLVYTYNLLTEKRILLVNGNDKSKSNAQILSYFKTPIEVFVTKQKMSATASQVEAGFAKIVGHEYLTGDYAFYYGNDHEKDGGESSGPTGTPFGLIGVGPIDEGYQYYYKLVYQEPDNGVSHEYRMH